ncbi:hypothetical protein GIB67_025589 [Kingdonia uniflora]|uniref:Uncharacterized protein n=1 Tax=Kingdonia uniflora TaxID=39325 RepID=A0A7J7M0N9_9MAGN|nr:hypothetical protein GIB67_025589 [Kingdonia uniflora]
MAAEIYLSQIPELVEQPNALFLSSHFFTEQLTAFEVWLDHGSEHKKPPEQLHIVLQVLTFSKNLQFKGIYYCVYTEYFKTYTIYENI